MAEQTLRQYFSEKLSRAFAVKSQDAVVDKFKLRDLCEQAFNNTKAVDAFRKGAEYAFKATGINDGLTITDAEARKELNLG